MTDDAWNHNDGLISRDRAHAVGLVVLYSNLVEDGIRSLLSRYSGMGDVEAAHFTFSMDVSKMIETSLRLAELKEADAIVLEHIKHGLAVANICRQNRNIIAHSWINFSGDKLFKPSNRGAPLTRVYDFDLKVIRRVADEIWECGHYLMFLGLYIAARGDPHWRQSLPGKPLKPQSLTSIDQYGPEALARRPSTFPD
ncbi:hypothetical protein [Shinella granuli]|uniref:Uncharacterized protein n=1 Tax=Shinella granuli TaxID=323621 RepID=A0A4R2BVL1_SHIGR|nr:hypothetical protein [Shinella granuli]TCN31626.1 hypothetical protein EV665_1522 [Shinella granuli]